MPLGATLFVLLGCREITTPSVRTVSDLEGVEAELTPAATYTPTDLGVLLTGAQSSANGINSNGDVVGWSDFSATSIHPVLWVGNVPTDLGTPQGYNSAVGEALNDARVVVGQAFAGPNSVGFVWSGGHFTLVPSPGGPGGDQISLRSINNSNEAVGSFRLNIGPGTMHAFRYSGTGGLVDIHPSGYLESEAYSVSDQGVVVGYVRTLTNETHLAVWSPIGALTDAGMPANSAGAVGYAVNAAGTVVGQAFLGSSEPFTWTSAAGFRVLPVGGYAKGISDKGRLVGTRQTFQPPAAATRKGGVTSLLPLLPGAQLSAATAVNRCGTVAGGVGFPMTHAVRWTISVCD